MKVFLLYIAIFFSPILLSGQILGMETSWTDQFDQWTIYAIDEEGEEIEGDLRQRWAINEDWSEWDYRIGEDFGAIKVKFKGDVNKWELRGGNEIIDIQTIYRNDLAQWRIRSGSVTLRLELNRRDLPFDWRVDDEDYGFYEVYTEWEGDPNAWKIVDEMSEDISIHMKMALVFLSKFSSVIN